ncbi:unnamed protein product [Echinostoma caproni]|uniref:Neur_chan_memb domain-containing protein n=1 Tax=Echinostoma caproni TaxID=27848 RepID=A0A183BH20_9TREM|nr:unnamed protein product [Echinostoma caproni]
MLCLSLICFLPHYNVAITATSFRVFCLSSSLTPHQSHFHALPNPQQSNWRSGVNRPGALPSATGQPCAAENYASPIRLGDETRNPCEVPLSNPPGTRVPDDPNQRLRDWLSGPIELEDPVDETLAYLREMLDWRLLFSITFLVLIVACSLNMLGKLEIIIK